MNFIGKSCATRRTFVIGGLATGTLVVASPAFAQASAVRSVGLAGAPRDDTVDILHGVTIPDPFRPLEDSSRVDVKAWIDAEDERARAHIDALPIRKQVREFFDAALDYPHTTVPARYASRYFTLFS
jgi:prolyl oligopeptidase